MSETENEGQEYEIDLGAFEPVQEESDDLEIDLGLGEVEAEPQDEQQVDLDLPTADEAAADAEAEAEEDDATAAAIATLREELESKFGEWYVIHTYSGMENRVKQNVDSRAQSLNMEDYIFETVVPTEDVVEIRNNTRKTVTRCVLPGYVLVRMDLTDESWGVVRHTPSVTGFVGHGQTPVPLSVDEVVKMLTPSVVAKVAAESSGKSASQRGKRKVEVVDFQVGDSVMVTDGPFTGVHATITEINANTQRLRALVEILGRETPVDLEFRQVEKVV
ncbi:transcription termination/antitermination protein NusG [Tessaracoccus sp. OS52]|uniref:transcription termination/antitermination protein NusG n=1 Tax=Tessaracoccus sp. OS52 TaxID=2886691 RepID=UPI001D0FD3EF|nr:transcription termination/antitermination protein NusG [Tessaracoccus sp. OS52]MCC2592175.1 transcription termination/antitermination protein NusG [Tessaracoccus sp. OS52]